MTKPLPNPPPGFDELSIDDKIDYIQSLWERVAAAEDDIPIPDWHNEIIQRRIAELESNPSVSIPWEQVREEIANRLQKK